MSDSNQLAVANHAVSPVVGVILMVAVTVILSAVVGLFAAGLSDNTQETAKAGVSISDNGDGSVDVQAISIDRADEIRVLVDGTQKATITDAGGTSTVPGGAITVVGVLDGEKTVLQTVPETETSTPPETVSGTVSINPPIEGANVTAIGPGGSRLDTTKTDSEGNYTLEASNFTGAEILVNVEDFESSATTTPLYTSASLSASTDSPVSVDFDKTKSFDATVNGSSVSVIHRGAGTDAEPHTIGNLHQLQAINHSNATLDDSYELVTDIDASETENWNSGAGFEPIGEDFFIFYSGTFDGDNHAVDSLFIDRNNRLNVGLFGQSEGTIENIAVTNADVSGDQRTGALLGRANEGTGVSNASASGDVSGADQTGGLIGATNQPSDQVSNSSASVKVVSDEDDVGGLIGDARGPVSNSFATGNVSGSEEAGGLIGVSKGPVSNSNASGDVSVEEDDAGGLIGNAQDGSTVSNSSATGDVSANGIRVGGLIGNNDDEVSDSFATGNVSGANAQIGGLVGTGLDPISDSFATGDVNGANKTGGLVGFSRDTVSNSFATGDVNGATDTGGLVGKNNDDAVSNSFATGNVSAETNVGGLIGISDGTVSNSSASGEVRGDTNVGGLVGDNADFRKFGRGKGTIANSFATGEVSAETNVGGLIGNQSGDVTDSYWDEEATNQSTSADGTGLTTSEMQGSAAEENMDGFDFDNVWQTVTGDYPELRE